MVSHKYTLFTDADMITAVYTVLDALTRHYATAHILLFIMTSYAQISCRRLLNSLSRTGDESMRALKLIAIDKVKRSQGVAEAQ